MEEYEALLNDQTVTVYYDGTELSNIYIYNQDYEDITAEVSEEFLNECLNHIHELKGVREIDREELGDMRMEYLRERNY